jgi:hypothetical protein
MVKQVLSQFTNLLSKMIEASEKGFLQTMVSWVRLMRNKLYMKNSTKVETLVEYLKAQYLDEAASAKLVEEGILLQWQTNCLLLIRLASQKRVLAAFKYVKLIDQNHR